MKSFKKLHKVICLIISILITASLLGGCEFSITTGSSSSRESQASKQESLAPESLPSDVAVKYKDYEIDFDEYKMIVAMAINSLKDKSQNVSLDQFVSSGNINGQPVADFVKQSSIQRATDFLRYREKFKQLGAYLDSKSKNLLQDAMSDSKSLEYVATFGVSQDVYKNYLEDYAKFCALKNGNIDLGEPEVSEVTVNEEAIGKVDIFDLAKRVDECLKNGAQFVQ